MKKKTEKKMFVKGLDILTNTREKRLTHRMQSKTRKDDNNKQQQCGCLVTSSVNIIITEQTMSFNKANDPFAERYRKEKKK